MDLWQLVIDQLSAAAKYKRPQSSEEVVIEIVFSAILAGCKTTKSIMAKTSLSSSTISKYLRLIEARGSIKIIRHIRNGPSRVQLLRDY